jgi:hypothetical protein
MQAFLRELTLLVAVTGIGGVALTRAVTPGSLDGASWRPMDNPPGDMTSRHACARRDAVLGSHAPARFEFEVDRPARFLGARGRPRGIPHVEPSRRPLIQFVVDTRGNVVVSSLKVLSVRGDSAATAAAIGSVARRWHYSPAIVDGCPTPQVVQTTVEP